MNERITFFSRTAGQNEDGEVVDTVRKDVYSCWTEISGTTIKDFRTVSGIETGKDSKTFIIQYHPRPPFDTSMYIDFRKAVYKITEIHVDYAGKDYILVKATSAE
ncbi:head-tail adaptor protein [Streptococcus suis]|nr:head-tail adaptor protein [Streptococcus suis]MCO8200934.1 head-tail adaptor protein [Streptococcus suis]MCO8218442.1 head-tail adaptor protein [Streptococcus suis]